MTFPLLLLLIILVIALVPIAAWARVATVRCERQQARTAAARLALHRAQQP